MLGLGLILSTALAAELPGAAEAGLKSETAAGATVICSRHVRVQVSPLSPPSALDLDAARARKDADDAMAYADIPRVDGQGGVRGTADLVALAQARGYYGSEQHLIWAWAASARVSGLLTPASLMELEPFGGTAGNGPELLPFGGPGERLSTIAVAHDTDWLLGRLFGLGPLAGLATIDAEAAYQLKRLGAAGLMRPTAAEKLNPAKPVAHPVVDAKITELLWDTSDELYGGAMGLRQGVYGWQVAYTPNYSPTAPDGAKGKAWWTEPGCTISAD